MSAVTDITPDHSPVAVAREMVDTAINRKATAGAWVLVSPEGTLISDCAGVRTADLVWALTRMLHEIMHEDMPHNMVEDG